MANRFYSVMLIKNVHSATQDKL